MQINLSTRPEKAVGSDEIWATAEDALREALAAKGWDYQVSSHSETLPPFTLVWLCVPPSNRMHVLHIPALDYQVCWD